MLFDLRRRGRRRAVKTIYIGLAVLLFVGLVGFGVGTGVSGTGIFSAAENSGTGGGSSEFAKEVAAAQTKVKRDPSDPAAWKALTEAQLREAGSNGELYDQATQGFTSKGRSYLATIGSSWSRYLKLEPNHPDPDLADRMLIVYGEEGLDEPAEAMRALEILIPSREPSAALYADLAEYAYRAGNNSQGELASRKAVSLTPHAEQGLIKSRLESVKQTVEKEAAEKAEKEAQASQEAGGAGAPATGPTVTQAGEGEEKPTPAQLERAEKAVEEAEKKGVPAGTTKG